MKYIIGFIVVIVVIVCTLLFFSFLAWRGFGAGGERVCEDVLMIERRWGVDRPLSDVVYPPADHIVYNQEECMYVKKPRVKPTESFADFIKAVYFKIY